MIPKPVRDELGIAPGDEVYFSTHEDHAHLEKRPSREALKAFFAGLPERPPGRHLTAQDMKQLREQQYEQESTESGS